MHAAVCTVKFALQWPAWTFQKLLCKLYAHNAYSLTISFHRQAWCKHSAAQGLLHQGRMKHLERTTIDDDPGLHTQAAAMPLDAIAASTEVCLHGKMRRRLAHEQILPEIPVHAQGVNLPL